MEKAERRIKPKTTVKHGGGSVIVCISAHGVGELLFIDDILDKNKCLSILQNNLKKSATKNGDRTRIEVLYDNDPKHKARIVQEFLYYICANVLQLPP